MGHKTYSPGRANRYESADHHAAGRKYGRKSGKEPRPDPAPARIVMFRHAVENSFRVVAFWQGRKIVGHTERGCAVGLIKAGADLGLPWVLYDGDKPASSEMLNFGRSLGTLV